MGKDLSVERRAMTESLALLPWQQRVAIDALLTTESVSAAHRKLVAAGVVVKEAALRRWTKSPAFRRAWRYKELDFAKQFSRESTLVKTQAVLEEAMQGTPIIGRSGPDTEEVVGYRKDLPSALRAIELQGKATGAFVTDAAQQVAILVDIDFSGRKEPVIAARYAEAAEVSSQPRPTGSGLTSGDDWLE